MVTGNALFETWKARRRGKLPLDNHIETRVLVDGPGNASNFLQFVPETGLRDLVDPTHMLEITKLILCRQEPNRSHSGVRSRSNHFPGVQTLVVNKPSTT